MLVERKKALEALVNWKDKDLIKVITGIRRCGKSTLLELFQDHLLQSGIAKSQIHSINFEDLNWIGLQTCKDVWDYLKPLVENDNRHYIFLDEVQRLPEFETLVNGLYARKNIDLYVTGSNAFLLSSELATYLSGRYVEVHLTPFSFKEFYDAAHSGEISSEVYARYLVQSGFPYALQLSEGQFLDDYLSGIFNTILLKDVVGRFGFKDVPLLDRVTRFLFDNIGNPTSILKIANALERPTSRPNSQTIENYIRALCDSYILHQVRRYDIKGKAWLKTNAKYYLEDVGLRRILLGTKTGDLGRILENVIYLELKRRHRDVFVGMVGNTEIDFVVSDSGNISYYQVALTVRDTQTLERELKPLQRLHDSYPKYLLTLDDDPPINHKGIIQINALKFLLSNDL